MEYRTVNEQLQCWFDKGGLKDPYVRNHYHKIVHPLLFTRCKRGNWERVEKMKEADFIEPSISPFAAPMVCVQKGNGSLRVTINF